MYKKLMLVDDHLLFVEGLKYLLETYGITVVGIANNGREAILKARELKPDIILLDVKMPDYSGLDVLKIIKAEMEEVKIIMLTASEEDEDLFEALKLGASGYILKNLDGDELVSMLEGIERGEAPLSCGLSARILQEFQRIKQNGDKEMANNLENKDKINLLSKRQIEVIELVSMGKTYKETASCLNIAERTVHYHMREILDKLHLDNRSQVIAYAARRGFIKNKADKES